MTLLWRRRLCNGSTTQLSDYAFSRPDRIWLDGMSAKIISILLRTITRIESKDRWASKTCMRHVYYFSFKRIQKWIDSLWRSSWSLWKNHSFLINKLYFLSNSVPRKYSVGQLTSRSIASSFNWPSTNWPSSVVHLWRFIAKMTSQFQMGLCCEQCWVSAFSMRLCVLFERRVSFFEDLYLVEHRGSNFLST